MNFKLSTWSDVTLLVIATVSAILFVNIPLTMPYYDHLNYAKVGLSVNHYIFEKPFNLWVNEGLMAVFFFFVVLEVRYELVYGILRSRSAAVLPVVAALGGVIVPALIYYQLTYHNPQLIQGWAIPTATDIVFALAVFQLIFKDKLPGVKMMLLSLAIVDDILGILIIAFYYSNNLNHYMISVSFGGACLMMIMRYFDVIHRGYYYFVGIVMWVAVVKSGVHATLAGVVLAMMVPFGNKESMKFLILRLSKPVNRLILPVFAFCNAGISVEGISVTHLKHPMVLGIVLGLWLGKPLGVVSFSVIANKLGIVSLPKELDVKMLSLIGLISGIGFTLSLFIGLLAFGENPVYDDLLRLGVFVGSILSGLSAYILAHYWGKNYD